MKFKPVEQKNLYEHKETFNHLKNLYDQHKFPNKIIISGQKGIGKSTLAYHFANYLFSKNEEHKYDFLNCFFENSEDLNRVFFSKKYLNTKSFNNESINYHSFSWLVSAKKLGGIQTVTNCKKHIFDWQNKKYNIFRVDPSKKWKT